MTRKLLGNVATDQDGQSVEPSGRDGELLHVFTAGEKHQLFGMIFSDSELSRVDFSGADLREALFVRASLTAADFSGADLRGASFIGCDLRGARFDHAIMGHTSFDRSWLVGARGLSAQMADYVRTRGGLLWFS